MFLILLGYTKVYAGVLMEEAGIREAAKKAEQVANGFEEPYKSIIFKTVFEKLISGGGLTEVKQETEHAAQKVSANGDQNNIDIVCSKINRTDHPEISKLKTAKDRSVFILKLARDFAGVDGLFAREISDVLNRVFRLRVTRESITMVLGPETKFVDRKTVKTQGGDGFIYRVMAPGEDYLNTKLRGDAE